MKRIALLPLLFLFLVGVAQQQVHQSPKVYQATPERINNLVHTKLDAKFDYAKQQMNGKVWITLKPHFYPTDSLLLDAKGMDITEVSLVCINVAGSG